MYQYDGHDQAFVRARAAEFRDQVERRVAGQLTEDEFKPLRLKNGLYLQLHAYMLRVAIPYGTLSADQMRTLALLADRYDRGYGHFTTRQNIQYNWTRLEDVPAMMDILADAQMHAIQTSGNCIRNVTSDAFAGAAGDEDVDPRPTAELLRQWSSLHPEFAYLPRKFKFAVIGAADDRAAMKFHDIGVRAHRGEDGRPRYDIWVGGGQGRTPRVGVLFEADVPFERFLPTLDSMLRVYNLAGRRDNKYKARIKILVAEMGLDDYRAAVHADMATRDASQFDLAGPEYDRIAAQFSVLPIEPVAAARIEAEGAFAAWLDRNVIAHKVEGHAVVSISLKGAGDIPGDATAAQMRAVADLADRHSASEIRVTHRQNLVLPHVPQTSLRTVYDALVEIGLATGNIGLTSDIIACPGLDYCALATARSIPIAQALSTVMRQREAKAVAEGRNPAGPTLNISGCINACGHHHAANIGILGLNKAEQETYQITLGGRADADAAIGDVLGPGFTAEEVPDAVARIIDVWEMVRDGGESFADTYARLGKAPFKAAVYEESIHVAA
ncbi:nitrite/sulfite reductase [Acuticoccus sp. MNP-M23]|uniref:nitrite/sulfite reductase n=1 Tax=Acuticoccus sp. MNP-M23 TaxID=3072793 RepID=UPI002815FCBA|nr:nitrite/sulfite reductase [Acuticoccus sp. MNP-M23]WMS43996.1 nitrite/sulfite reductase [Acuticoccus sp. MNP-M23]